MVNDISYCCTLQNGVEMPFLGFGVFKVSDDEVELAVKTAIRAGYRSIDTATIYENEEGVGKAIKNSGVPRNELFVTTKVWNSDQGFESTLKAFETSRRMLGLEYLDLYLVHWPVKGKYKETWRAMEKLYTEGLVRAIGVSNFYVNHLEDILTDCNIVPMVNQVEYHPLLTLYNLKDYCKNKKIQLIAWSPLMQGNLDHAVLVDIGKKYGKSPSQVVLRWDIQNEIVTIPKSIHEKRIYENRDIFDFELTQEDIKRINGMNRNHRYGPDPENFNF